MREVMHWSDEGGVLMDILLHAGSLLAILVYFHRDWISIYKSFFVIPGSPQASSDRKLIGLLIVATIPVVVVGPFLMHYMHLFRHGGLVGIIMILTAAWFVLCERQHKLRVRPLGWITALLMGTIQVIALLPGASRSGLTIGAGLWCGHSREKAAKFSFFMAIPTILGAVILQGMSLSSELGTTKAPLNAMIIGFIICFLVSLLAIHYCLMLFKRHSLVGFGIYLAILGVVLVAMKYLI